MSENLTDKHLIDFSRWLPVANDLDFLEGYFSFPLLEKSNDSGGKRIRFFTMAAVLENLASSRPLSNIVECGCFFGHSTHTIATIAKKHGFQGTFHVFDSFEGLSDPQNMDVESIAKTINDDDLAVKISPKNGKRRLCASEEVVVELFGDFPFMQFHKGWIPEHFLKVRDETFSFVHIDVDLYQPTLDSLLFFYPRVEPGGVIVIDDFWLDTWPGCTLAVNQLKEVFDTTNDHLIPIAGGGLIIIKGGNLQIAEKGKQGAIDERVSAFDRITAPSPPKVLVFLPSTNELQRFVLGGAFDGLAREYDVQYVVPPASRQKMLEAAPNYLNEENTHELKIPDEQFKKWSKLFKASCFAYAGRSMSFGLRVGLNRQADNNELAQLTDSKTKKTIRKLLENLAVKDILNTTQKRTFVQKVIRYAPASIAVLRENKLIDLLNWEHLRHLLYKKANQRDLVKHAIAAKNLSKPTKSKSPPISNAVKSDGETEIERLIQNIEPDPGMVDLLHRMQPCFSIIPTSLLDPYCNDLLYAAELNKHTVMALQSGWDNPSSKGVVHHQPSFFGVWGDQSANHAKFIQGISRKKLHLLGSPHYEALIPAQLHKVKEFRKNLGVSSDDTLILFGGSFRQFDETSALAILEEAISTGEYGSCKILYRPHPWRLFRDDEDNFFEREWEHIVFDTDMADRYVKGKEDRNYIKRNVPMFSMDYLALLLSSVDAAISPMSTLLLESMIMNRPTMAVAFGDGKHGYNPLHSSQMTHFQGMKSSRALVWCDDEKYFEKRFAELLNLARQGKNAPNLKKKNQLIEQIVVRSPVPYSERLLEFCKTTVEPLGQRKSNKRWPLVRKSISNVYGALHITNEYCSPGTEITEIPGYWMHGWIPEYHNIDPHLIALHKQYGQDENHDFISQVEEEKKTTEQWVAREDQAVYLRKNGYSKVKAIGLPFLYLPETPVPRIPKSLLVMPPHGHGIHGPGTPIAEEYAETILSKSDKFDDILVCLNAHDFNNKQWIESFKKRNIRVFCGALQSERQTLLRLKKLMLSFEYVTTNGFGSHIAYAAACGAKTSVFGPFAEFPLAKLQRTHALRRNPDIALQANELFQESALRKIYPFLFCLPEDAEKHEAWGIKECGGDEMLSPEALAKLFKNSTGEFS